VSFIGALAHRSEGHLETISKRNCLSRQESGGNQEVDAAATGEWENRWIEAAQRGDTESFERIVLAYQQKVYNLAFRLLADRGEAEDITQEIFINVFRHIASFQGKSQFSTWIYQVTMNHCRNRLKYLKRRYHHATESLDDPLLTKEGEIERLIPDEGDVPEDVLYRQQVQDLVQTAFGMLRDDFREVIVLRDVQEFSYQEISQVLELPEGTIKSRLHRARMELKEILIRLGIKRD